MKYQGWANYQTWAVNLWYNNDQGLQNMCLEIARNGQVTEDPRTHTADALKEYTETANPLQDEASMFSDLMTHAISSVDWYEIADAFLEMVKDEGEESEERVTGNDNMPQVECSEELLYKDDPRTRIKLGG